MKTRPTSRERARPVPVSSTAAPPAPPPPPAADMIAVDMNEPSHRSTVWGSTRAGDRQEHGAAKASQQQQQPMAASSATATGLGAPAVATPFGKTGSNRRDGINNTNALSSSSGVEARTNRDLAGSSPSPSLDLGGKEGVDTLCTAGMGESAGDVSDSRERNPKWFMTKSSPHVVGGSSEASRGEPASGVGGRPSRESASCSRGDSALAAASPRLSVPVEDRSSGDARGISGGVSGGGGVSVNGDGGTGGGSGRREAQKDCRAGGGKPTERGEASAGEGVGAGTDIGDGEGEEFGNGGGGSDDEADVWFELQAGNSRKTQMEETSASGAVEAAPASSSSSGGGGGSSSRGRAGGGRITSSRPPRSGGGKSGGAVLGGKISGVVGEGKSSGARATLRTESLTGISGRSVGDAIPVDPVGSGKDICKPKEIGGRPDGLRRPTTVDELLDCLVEHRDSEGK